MAETGLWRETPRRPRCSTRVSVARNHGGGPSSGRSDLCERWRETFRPSSLSDSFGNGASQWREKPGPVPAGVSRHSKVRTFAPPSINHMNDSHPLSPRMLHQPRLTRPRAQLCPVGDPMAGVAIRARRHQPREMQPPDDFNHRVSHDQSMRSPRPSAASGSQPTKTKTPARAEAPLRPGEQLAVPPTAHSPPPPASRYPGGHHITASQPRPRNQPQPAETGTRSQKPRHRPRHQ